MSFDVFTHDSVGVRAPIYDGEPWFVAADVARLLEYRMASDMTRRLDDDEKGTRSVRTPGGYQEMTVISESGFYAAILGSHSPKAKAVKRWLTHYVLPSIRKTGSYSTTPALTDDELIHQALSISATRVAALTERVAELEPKALVAEKLLDATGDYEVADAAKVLSRSGVTTGRGRLFDDLHRRGWIYRHQGDGKWRVKQSALDVGYMAELPQSHYHPKTGIRVLDAPQPRVTPKGIERILKDYNRTGELVKA